MSSFFRSSTKVSKAEQASSYVKQYETKRAELIKKITALAIADIYAKIVDLSSTQGRSTFKFDFERFMRGNEKIKEFETESNVKDFVPTTDERDQIMTATIADLEAEKFKVVKKNSSHMEISWANLE